MVGDRISGIYMSFEVQTTASVWGTLFQCQKGSLHAVYAADLSMFYLGFYAGTSLFFME